MDAVRAMTVGRAAAKQMSGDPASLNAPGASAASSASQTDATERLRTQLEDKNFASQFTTGDKNAAERQAQRIGKEFGNSIPDGTMIWVYTNKNGTSRVKIESYANVDANWQQIEEKTKQVANTEPRFNQANERVAFGFVKVKKELVGRSSVRQQGKARRELEHILTFTSLEKIPLLRSG
jgi:hypothetical protein